MIYNGKYSGTVIFSPVLTLLNIKGREIEDIIAKIADMISDRPVVIGINGLDCSGKTTFASALYDKLSSKNMKCALLHIDDYNNFETQKVIYEAHAQGAFTEDFLDLFYTDSIHYDNAAKAIAESRHHYAVTIIEGVFLFKDCLAPVMDIKIFLPVDPALAKARYVERKEQIGDDRPLSVFDDIWLPAFERYVREVQPENMSDFIYR